MTTDVEPETIERATSTVARVLGELDQAHPGLSGEIVAALVRADVLAPRVIDLGAENKRLLLLDAIQLAHDMAEEDGPVTEEELEALRKVWPPD